MDTSEIRHTFSNPENPWDYVPDHALRDVINTQADRIGFLDNRINALERRLDELIDALYRAKQEEAK